METERTQIITQMCAHTRAYAHSHTIYLKLSRVYLCVDAHAEDSTCGQKEKWVWLEMWFSTTLNL